MNGEKKENGEMDSTRLYHVKERLTSAYASLGEGILPENLTAINECITAARAKGVKPIRELKYVFTMRAIGKAASKPFKKMRQKDVEQMLDYLKSTVYSPHSKRDYDIFVKMLFRRVKPKAGAFIKIRKVHNTLNTSDLLTNDEILRLIKAADTNRKRAFISILAESGARIGEVLRMRIRDATPDKRGIILSLKGKTGPRPVLVVYSALYLTQYINDHPQYNNPDAQLWFTNKNNEIVPLEYGTARKMVKTIFNDAGVSLSKCAPYRFRHSRVTQLKRLGTIDVSNQEKIFGWRPGSSVHAEYSHLCPEDAHDAIAGASGLKQIPREPPISVGECARCHKILQPTEAICCNCGTPAGATYSQMSTEAQIAQFIQLVRTKPEALATIGSIVNMWVYSKDSSERNKMMDAICEIISEAFKEGDLNSGPEAPDGTKVRSINPPLTIKGRGANEQRRE